MLALPAGHRRSRALAARLAGDRGHRLFGAALPFPLFALARPSGRRVSSRSSTPPCPSGARSSRASGWAIGCRAIGHPRPRLRHRRRRPADRRRSVPLPSRRRCGASGGSRGVAVLCGGRCRHQGARTRDVRGRVPRHRCADRRSRLQCSADPACPPRQITAFALVNAALLALLASALATVLYLRLIQEIGPTRSMTVTFLIPVWGIFWSALLLGEPSHRDDDRGLRPRS